MAFDEQGQAATYEEKIRICETRYRCSSTKSAFRPRTSFSIRTFLTVATGMEEHNNYAVDSSTATRWIKQNLPHAR